MTWKRKLWCKVNTALLYAESPVNAGVDDTDASRIINIMPSPQHDPQSMLLAGESHKACAGNFLGQSRADLL